jgi:succinate-acetate transporter protein
MWGSVSNRSCRLFIAFFILTLTFSLISAGILNANTTIGMAAYAKK